MRAIVLGTVLALPLSVAVLADPDLRSKASADVRGAPAAGVLPAVVGGETLHVVVRGETLTSLGARFGVVPAVLTRLNALDPSKPLRVGQTLRIEHRHIVPAIDPLTLVVNVPQRMVFYRGEGDELLAFPAAVGRRTWRTPVAEFTVMTKETDPTWDVPASIQEEARRAGRSLPAKVPPGPENPLGRHWLGLSIGGVGVHGTNAPSSIYQFATHGCIRLHPDDIAALHPRVRVGTHGRVVYEPVLLASVDGQVYVEVHPDVYGRLAKTSTAQVVVLRQTVRELASRAGVSRHIDWELADAVATAREGLAVRVSP